MATSDERTIQKTYRLPAGDVDMIERLAANQILGATPSAVVRAIITAAIRDIVQSEFVRKHKETVELLGKK